ncbi:hypothetical protein [Pseudomonas sp. NPDC090201]|jgi:hypothetical protein|uniref:hypothetical protein n=1 Tax=Pseudomonas sp. NPDC090201 TaxID=3364475 RepID=UPI003818AA18
MTRKAELTAKTFTENLEITQAIERYVAQGGIINVVAEGASASRDSAPAQPPAQPDPQTLMNAKLEQLKGLVAKGAGVTAIQYSLRMNRKEIRRLASEHGVKIVYSRPVRGKRSLRNRETTSVDDTVAGHAMHYSTLGYTVPEIAQLLGLSVRDVWNIGKAYRFEFKSPGKIDEPEQSSSDGSEPFR